MKIPRDISGKDLCKYLNPYGYEISRQSGSHVRLTSVIKGQHHVTVPMHDPLKIGTLAAIISDIALHFGISKEEMMQKLFS